jgi:hypothetical protein
LVVDCKSYDNIDVIQEKDVLYLVNPNLHLHPSVNLYNNQHLNPSLNPNLSLPKFANNLLNS